MRTLRNLILIVAGLLVLAIIGFFSFAPAYVEKARNAVTPHAPYPVSDVAQALHDRLIIGDLHADPLLWNRDLSKRGTYGQVDVLSLIHI